MWVLPDGNFFDRGREPPGQNARNRFSSNQYRVCPYSTTKCDCNIDKRFKSGFYHLVDFDRGQKSCDWKDDMRFSGEPDRVCSYSTIQYFFNIDKRF